MARTIGGNKKERIQDAAVVEIAQRGYHQTTVARIAKRAGVADGTIYLYFKNKEEILFSLFERAMSRFIDEGRGRLEKMATATDKLCQIIELHLTIVGRDRDQAIITQVELRHSLHFMGQLSRAQVGEYLGIIGQIVAEGQKTGEFRSDLDPVFAAKAVFGVLDEMATDWVLSHRNTRLESKSALASDFILAGLRS
jgi:TetR/AcrR family transcriptional regulator, fatty acid metabolism regulator protein